MTINDQPHPTVRPTEEQERRAQTQLLLGLHAPDRELDRLATRLALATGIPDVYAMVNPFTSTEQQFVGLHIPDNGDLPTVGRSMPLDHGFCPEVVDRKRALVLPDVFASPRFAGNPVVDQIGIRTYAGAPLIHEGIVLGTVCFVGLEEQPQDTGQASLALIKEHRDAVMDFLYRRAGYQPPQ
ncbi:GAF domain-containing protein [Streptomyces turgidiscabies]|uniref:GAF domain-containing protein n=1 Tax=Streptomyces turgidiscabies TaxID=85558 RepID=UPI0038F79F26